MVGVTAIRSGISQWPRIADGDNVLSALEHGLSSDQLSHDAADRPQVDRGAIVIEVQDDLRSTVPACRNVLGHEAVGRQVAASLVAATGTVAASEAEVTDLELTFSVDEQASGLEIAVNDVRGVDIFESAEGLVDEGLVMCVREWLMRADDCVQVGFQERFLHR